MQSNYCIGAFMAQKFPVIERQLKRPDLKLLANVLENGLQQHFFTANVDLVDCPDLMEYPFCLASKGICGRTSLIDVGDASYSMPYPKLYDIKDILINLGRNDSTCFVLGDSYYLNMRNIRKMEINDLIFNTTYASKKISPKNELIPLYNKSQIIRHKQTTDECEVNSEIANYDSNCAIRGTFFVSDGLAAPLLRVIAKNRRSLTDSKDVSKSGSPAEFINSMRNALHIQFGNNDDQLIVLGGVYITRNAFWKHTFVKNKHFFRNANALIDVPRRTCSVNPPVTRIGAFHSSVTGIFPGLQNTLKLNNPEFHCLSHKNEAQICLTQYDNFNVEYVGYFYPAETVYRIDQPFHR